MNIPDWVWVVGSLTLLLFGLQLGVSLGRAGETARHGKTPAHSADDLPAHHLPTPKVSMASINLDLSAPAKDKTADSPH